MSHHDETESLHFTFGGHAGPVLSFATDPEEERREERLIEREDWEGLVKLRRRSLKECPCPLCQAALGEALLAAGRPAEALAVLAPAEREEPGDPWVVELILDALQLQDKTEEDFQWTERPVVRRLDRSVLDTCHEHVLSKEGPVRVSSLRTELFGNAFVDFDEERLTRALRRDERFSVSRNERRETVVEAV